MACKSQRVFKFEIVSKSDNVLKDYIANIKESEYYDGQIVKTSDGFGPINERTIDYGTETNDFIKLKFTMITIVNNYKIVDTFSMSWLDQAEIPNFSFHSEKFKTWCEVGLD